jgi:carboxylate-amine ligase
LHVLLALSANSPVWRGRDTGFASWRAVQGQRWGVEGVPPAFRDAPDYYRRVDMLLATGVVLDRAQLYWSMRLAERHPTVEVRVADVQLDVEAAVMIAAFVRALAVVALREARDELPVPDLPVELVRAAGWQAARHGTSADLVDLTDLDGGPGGMPRMRPAEEVVGRLLDHVAPAARVVELDQVLPTVAATLIGAGGADRQRRALARGGLPELLDLLRVHTLHGARGPAPSPSSPGGRTVLSGT